MSPTVKRFLEDTEKALNYATAMPKTWREVMIELGGLTVAVLAGLAYAIVTY